MLLADLDVGRFRELLETNVIGAALLTRECLPHLKDGGGNIVNIASGVVDMAQGAPGSAPYSVSKAAVAMLSKVVAVEAARAGEAQLPRHRSSAVGVNGLSRDVLRGVRDEVEDRVRDVLRRAEHAQRVHPPGTLPALVSLLLAVEPTDCEI